MEISQIEAFNMISQVKGFSKAATMLHLSQPAISRRINMLEQELGCKLFERLHGGVRLTEAGKAFLPFACQLLAAARDGIEAVRALERKEQGTVELALVGSLASTSLTGKLLNFREKFPDVRLQLRTALSKEVSAMVQSGDVHLGLRYFADPNPAIISRTVVEEPLVVVCSANYNRSKIPPSNPLELRDIPWISFPVGEGSSGEPFAKILQEQLQLTGLSDAEIVNIDSLTAQKRLVELDFGLGLMPISSIHEELRLGSLLILDVPEIQTTAPVSALYRQHGYLSKAAKALLSILVDAP